MVSDEYVAGAAMGVEKRIGYRCVAWLGCLAWCRELEELFIYSNKMQILYYFVIAICKNSRNSRSKE